MADRTVNIKGNTSSTIGGGLTETGGADLAMGAVTDGEFLKRSGNTIISDTAGGGGGGTVQGTDATYDIQATNDGATDGNARGENSVDLSTSFLGISNSNTIPMPKQQIV